MTFRYRLKHPFVLYHDTGTLHRPGCGASKPRPGGSQGKDYAWLDDGTEVVTENPYDVLDLFSGCCTGGSSSDVLEQVCCEFDSMIGTRWETPKRSEWFTTPDRF